MTSIILAILVGIFGADGAGTTVMPLLKIGQGPSGAGLGEAYVSIADGASAIYWNPAGLGQAAVTNVAFSHQWWFTDISDEVVHVSLPGGIGFGLVASGDPGVQSWDENNVPGDTFTTWDGILSVGYGVAVAPGIRLGGTLKGLYQNLHTTYGFGGAADLGILYRPLPYLSLGLTGRNFGAMVYHSDAELLPMEVALGASATTGRFRATADLVLPSENTPNVRAGLEYMPVTDLSLRIGYRTGPADLSTLSYQNGLTAGLGLRVGNFDFGYSFTPYGVLGSAHRIGVGVLIRQAQTVGFKVKVTDARTGDPLQAELEFSGVRRERAFAGRTGEFELPSLALGRLVITARHDGYLPSTETVYVHPDREKSRTLSLQPVDCGGVWGGLRDAGTGKSIGGVVAYTGRDSGEVPAPAPNGTFVLKALEPGSYVFTARGPSADYQPQSCTLQVAAGRLTAYDFVLLRPGPVLQFGTVRFPTASADIGAEFDALIDSVGQALLEKPDVAVELAGHADGFEIELGVFRSRWQLSQARADAVKARLLGRFAIAPDRLTARGYAETRALASSDTPEGQARNRAVEFIGVKR